MNTSHSYNQRVIEKCRLLIVLVMNIFLPIPHIKSGYLLWYMLHEENTNKTPTIRPRYRIVQSMNSWLIMKHSKVPAQSDREPVDDLDNRDKAVILEKEINCTHSNATRRIFWRQVNLPWYCCCPSLSSCWPAPTRSASTSTCRRLCWSTSAPPPPSPPTRSPGFFAPENGQFQWFVV